MPFLAHIRNFQRAEEGTVLLIFALALFIVIGGIAFTLDMSRFLAVKSRLAIASEMAAVAAAKNLRFLEVAEVQQLAIETVQANFRNVNLLGYAGETTPPPVVLVTPDLASGEVTVSAQATVTTTLLRALYFFDDVTVAVAVTARQDRPEAEIALVIEASDAFAASGALTEVTSAARDVIAALEAETATGEAISWALVPFGNALVNVAPHKEWVTPGLWPPSLPPDIPGTTAWTGDLAEDRWCVAPRAGASGEEATPPTGAPFPLALTLDSEIDAATGLPHFTNVTTADCRAEPILSLGAAAAVSAELSLLGGNGDAAYGRAMLWAERLLSPLWQGIWNADPAHPAAYDAVDISKVAVLIAGSAATDTTENARLASACTRMKGNGITIYVIDYLAPEPAATVFAACATTAGHYFRVSDAASLRTAAFSIAKFLTVVRFPG